MSFHASHERDQNYISKATFLSIRKFFIVSRKILKKSFHEIRFYWIFLSK